MKYISHFIFNMTIITLTFLKSLIIALSIISLLSVNSFARSTHFSQAFWEARKASSHLRASVSHSVTGTAQVTSAALSVPFFVAGAVGGLSNKIATELKDIATASASIPLELPDPAVMLDPDLNEDI